MTEYIDNVFFTQKGVVILKKIKSLSRAREMETLAVTPDGFAL